MSEGFCEQEIFGGMDFGSKELLNDQYRLSIDQHEAFILRVFKLTDDLHYIVRLVQRDRVSFETIISLAALNCKNIRQALTIVSRYLKLVTRVLSVSINEKNASVAYEIESNLKNNRVSYFAIAAFALILDKLLYEATHNLHVIESVELTFEKPPGFDSIEGQLPFNMLFDTGMNRIVFNKEHLNQEIKKSDLISTSVFIDLAEKQLLDVEAEENIVSALRALLLREIKSPPRLDSAAKALGYSPRNLRRKLATLGTTYQQVLDSVRFMLAKQMLDEHSASITAISFELGFKSLSEFGRNFKKWSGDSPSAYQKRIVP